MMNLPTNCQIYLYSQPTDMRKSFSGLAGIVRNELGKAPNDGSLFLFINARGNKMKILYWDRDGMVIWYKSLESGSFERLTDRDQVSLQLDSAELAMLLGGVSIQGAKRRRRYTAA